MMTIKRTAFRTIVRTLECITQLLPPKLIINLPSITNSVVDFYTIAFNNAELIKYQHEFLKKYIQDPYTYIIVDNSTKPSIRTQLYTFCKKNEIAYISLPYNFLNLIGGSYSHAMCLNYTYKHFICKRKPQIFAYIDHDCFPIKNISVSHLLENQPIFGPLRQRGKYWYISSILAIFRFDFLVDKHVDFMPVKPENEYLDTGGGNYRLFSKLDKDKIRFPSERLEPFRQGGDRHSDTLEIFDEAWLHTINGSYWKDTTNGKNELINIILNKALQNNNKEKQHISPDLLRYSDKQ